MKKKNVPLIVGLCFLAVVIAAIVIVCLSLDSIVKKGVETVGPQITKTTVTLDAVNLSILTGSAKVKGLVVGNPSGYNATNAISVGTIAVGVNPASILSDKLIVRSIRVESPDITFEGGLGGNNLSTILNNVNELGKSGSAKSTNAVAVSSASSKKLEVDDLVITGARVHAILTGMGGKEMSLTLPDIHLTDLGKGTEGITPTDLTRRVLSAISTATIKVVAKEATGLGKDATDAAGKAATEGVNKITKGLGGLIGK